VEPVKLTMSMSGWAAMASPTTGPGAGDQVEHAGGQAGVVDDLGEDVGVERGDLAGLEHHRAARGQRRGDLRRDLVQRVVPRRDAADDADRLLDHLGVGDLLLVLVGLRQLGGGGEGVDGQAGLDQLRQPLRHARLTGHDGGDLVHAGHEALGDPGAELGPLLRVLDAQPGKAALAALAAASTSCAVPSGMVPKTSPLVESWTSMVPVPVDGTHAPSM
jgi:hypothetical protein